MLRHNKYDLQMCRKPVGKNVGFVCNQHEGRCVICDYQFDEIKPTMHEVHLCDECGLVPKGEEKCIMCGAAKTSDVAYYCQYCINLERDRDGCPNIINQGKQRRLNLLRTNSQQ